MYSTWGRWFIHDEVEATSVDTASVWYLGCNGLIVRSSETTLYIDPYFDDGDPPNIVRMIPVPLDPADATMCDAVLVTHEHIDHMHPPSFDPLVDNCGATLYAPEASYDQPDYDGKLRAPEDQRRVIETDDEFDVGDFSITVCGANDPDAIEPVSYVIEHETGTLFHGGDSRPAETFESIGNRFDIDLGVLAFGSVGNIYEPDKGHAEVTRWYMDENQIIEAANQLQLERLAPSHYDMWRGVGADPKVLFEHAASHRYPRVIEPVKIGDRVDFTKPGIRTSALFDA